MKSVIVELANFSDNRLFEEVAEGVGHILANSVNLDASAKRLADVADYRGSTVLRNLAEEEATKMLVLLDVVRCPKTNQKDRVRTLKGFNDHVVKGVYAKACDWRCFDFAPFAQFVNRHVALYEFIGFYGFESITSNEIKSARENKMYVDFVQELTLENEERYWTHPSYEDQRYGYRTPKSLEVASALASVGMAEPDGLKIVADVWRKFEPAGQRYVDLIDSISETINLLDQASLTRTNSEYKCDQAVWNWPFPMWSLNLRLKERSLDEMRERRKKYISELQRRVSVREPRLRISGDTVIELSEMFEKWERDMDRLTAPSVVQGTNIRIIKGEIQNQFFECETYEQLVIALTELSEDERLDLMALAWFGRDEIQDWGFCYKHARSMSHLDLRYQAGLGNHWMDGLRKWEAKPELPLGMGLDR